MVAPLRVGNQPSYEELARISIYASDRAAWPTIHQILGARWSQTRLHNEFRGRMKSDVEVNLAQGSIAELGAHFRERSLSVEDAVGWYLSRIQRISESGPAINAVRETSARAIDDARRADQEFAAGRDRGPLQGIPVLLKDNILTADGMAATAGVAAFADFRPRREATVARRLRSAGAIIIGKANLCELADYVSDVMPSGFSGAGGFVRNPHGFEYGRGQGSSVGSAAAVAASLAVFAIGTETQNSIQTPAAYSSVVGYKPSVGMVSRTGIFPLVPSQDSPGPMTRSVEDAALVASVLAGADVRDTWSLFARQTLPSSIRGAALEGMRIGVPRRQMASRPQFASVLPLFENCLSRLSKSGATIVDPCDLPSAEQLQDVPSCVFRVEFKAALNAFLEDNDAPCGIASLQSLIAWNEAHPAAIPYSQSLLIAAQATSGLDAAGYCADRERDLTYSRRDGIDAALAMHNVHALIAPMGAAAKCTGKAGAPVVSIPTGLDLDGVPFGVSVFASVGGDVRLLAIARTIEAIVGGRKLPAC